MHLFLGIAFALLYVSEVCADSRDLIDPVAIFPGSDAISIKQDGRTVGSVDTLDIFGGTHFAYLIFDVSTAKDIIQMYLDNNKNPVDIRLRFVINWAPTVGTRIHLQQIVFPNLDQWDETLLDFETTQSLVEIGSELGTFVPRNDRFVEFDIRNKLISWLDRCNNGLDCRYMSFRLSTSDPHWLKVYSKEAYKEAHRPQIIFSEGLYALTVPIASDTGVVRQLPDRGFGYWPTLDLILYTHLAFMEFNLVDVLSKIQSIHATTSIKIRLYVEWAQAAWGTVTAEVVTVGKPLNENTFRYIDAEKSDVVVLNKIGTEHVCSSCFVEFDLTPLLTRKTDESSEKRVTLDLNQLNHFQIRLRTEQNAWVKFASKEYHDVSKRPLIMFSQMSWEDSVKPYRAIWHILYQFIFPPLQPILIGVVIALLLQITRKYIWPVIEKVMAFVRSKPKWNLETAVTVLTRDMSGNRVSERVPSFGNLRNASLRSVIWSGDKQKDTGDETFSPRRQVRRLGGDRP